MIEIAITNSDDVEVSHNGTTLTTVQNPDPPGVTYDATGVPREPNVQAAVAEWALAEIAGNGGLTDKSTAVIVDLAGARFEVVDGV